MVQATAVAPNITMSSNSFQTAMLRNPEKEAKARAPLFLQLDKTKLKYLENLYNAGAKTSFEVEKELLLPKELLEPRILNLLTPAAIERIIRVNEKLLDKHIVVNVADALDMAIKNIVLDYPDLTNGIVILNDYTYAFTELDNHSGINRDLKKALKSVQEQMVKSGIVDQKFSIGSIMTPYLPIPFEGSKLDYGTWGRPALIDTKIGIERLELTAALLKVKSIKRFGVRGKPQSGFWYKDVTEEVMSIAKNSGLDEGYALITTLHTTVGIIKMNPNDAEQFHDDLLFYAPDDPTQYYHNKLVRRGELKLRTDGRPLGDGNGGSHVKAALTGFYTVVPFKKGMLEIEDGERILQMDYDTLQPRERGVVVSLI
jgi:thiamine phosphate synthase YjbQ (UPF0047 family)